MADGDIRALVSLLDDLLAATVSDPPLVGTGPLEDLLAERPDEAAPVVAERGHVSERWRAALASVSLEAPDHPGLAPLAEFLPFK